MRIFIIIVLSFILSLPSIAGIGDWKTFTSKKDVRSISSDKNILWVATKGGMFSYNQNDSTFQEYTTSDGLKTIELNSIILDSAGTVWIGASNGIIQNFQPNKLRWVSFTDIFSSESPQKSINNFSVYGDTLFIASDIGVSVFSISKNEFRDTFIKFGVVQISGQVKNVLINNDTIWIATSRGIASAKRWHPNLNAPQSWNVFLTSNGLPSNDVSSFTLFNKFLYAATYGGLAMFNGSNWQVIDGTSGKNIVSLKSTENYLYFITTNELYRLSKENILELIPNSYQTNFSSLHLKNDEIYIGTTSKGIIKLVNNNWALIFPVGPFVNNFMGLAIDEVGDLWAGTGTLPGFGFVRFDGKKWFHYNVDNYPQLLFSTYYQVNIGRNNSKWVSNWGRGVALLNNQNEIVNVFNKWNGLPITAGVADTDYVVVAGVVTDKIGNAWINVRTGRGDTLLAIYKTDSTFSYVKSPYSFISTGITIDDNQTKWMSTGSNGSGLYFYNENRRINGMLPNSNWGRITKANGLSSDNISVVAIDNNNEIWAGTLDAGISIIFDALNPLNRIAQYNPLRDQKINDILVDPLDQKWVATSKGVYLLSPDGVAIIAEYTVKNTNGKLLDDNVLSITMNKKTGVIYFGTDKGLSTLQTSSISPQAVFEKILISPNPYLIPSDHPIVIDGLVRNSTLKILSIDGALVKEIITPGGRVGFWDGKDKNENYVSSGIYILVAYSEGGNQIGYGKIAIIKK